MFQRCAEWSFEGGIDGGLRHLHGRHIVASNRVGRFQRDLKKILPRYDTSNDAGLFSLLGIGTRQNAKLDFRLAELGFFRGNNEVAEKGEFASAAQSIAAYGCDDLLGDIDNVIPRAQEVIHIKFGGALLRHFFDIDTGGESAWTPGNHDHAAIHGLDQPAYR